MRNRGNCEKVNEIADLLTILGNHFPLVAIGSVEALAAVFLLAKEGETRINKKTVPHFGWRERIS